MGERHTTRCPPQPSFANLRVLLTISVYQSARSVPVGVNLRTALYAYTHRLVLHQFPHRAAEHSRLDGKLGLRPVSGLDDDTKRRPASPAEGEEQVLVLALVRGAVDTIRGDDLHLDLVAHHQHERRFIGTQAQHKCATNTYHPINGESVHRGQDTVTATLCACAISTDDGWVPCGEGGTHEEVSTREANGLVVSAEHSAVDAVGELIDVLREDPCLKWKLNNNVTAGSLRLTYSRCYGVVRRVFRAALWLESDAVRYLQRMTIQPPLEGVEVIRGDTYIS